MKIQNLVLVAGLAAVAAFVGYDYFENSRSQSRPTNPASNSGIASSQAPSQAPGFSAQPPAVATAVAQTSDEGQVEVTVTPGDLSPAAKTWDFTVSLNTHSVELAEDLAQVSVLIDEQGKEYRPLSWTGAPPGGHHREGVLSFDPIKPAPVEVRLEIRGVGGVAARRFTWNLSP